MSEVPRILIVTGASRGLGAHIAARAAQSGYRVLGAARASGEGPGFAIRACDVTDEAAVRALARHAAGLGLAYGLINAAGIAAMNLAVTTPPATVRRIIETNLVGTIAMCQRFAPLLMRAGTGRIINVSTIAVPLGLAGEAVYAASKAGVEAFTRSLARELSSFGITANCIAPGPIETDLIAGVPRPAIAKIVEQQVIRRQGTLEDAWDATRLLLADEARMISGQVLHIGGV